VVQLEHSSPPGCERNARNEKYVQRSAAADCTDSTNLDIIYCPTHPLLLTRPLLHRRLHSLHCPLHSPRLHTSLLLFPPTCCLCPHTALLKTRPRGWNTVYGCHTELVYPITLRTVTYCATHTPVCHSSRLWCSWSIIGPKLRKECRPVIVGRGDVFSHVHSNCRVLIALCFNVVTALIMSCCHVSFHVFCQVLRGACCFYCDSDSNIHTHT